MKRNIQYLILGTAALLCTALTLMPSVQIGQLLLLAAFPFKQIGAILRQLSLSGFAGNIAAITFYIIICLLPCVLLIRKSKKYYFEDCLILLLSASMFFVVYLMINPSLITLTKGVIEALPIGQAILGGSIYSIATGYLVLRTIRLFNKKDKNKLQGYLSNLLYILSLLFVAIIFLNGFGGCVSTIKAMHQTNSANESLFAINYIFTVLKFIAESLPYLFNIAIIFIAIDLLHNLGAANAEKLSKICCSSLAAVVLSNIAVNLLQLLFAGSLFEINTSVQIPLFSIIFTLACLLFAQIVKENAALKAENDGFI